MGRRLILIFILDTQSRVERSRVEILDEMSRRTSERAKTALYLLILINIFIYSYRDELQPYLSLKRSYRIHDGNLKSMLLSIFFHMDPTHLFMNMLALNRYGTELFVYTSSSRWQSTFVIIISYVACGLGAFIGVELLSQYHDYQWESKLRVAREANRCTHWFCNSLNDKLGTDISSYFTNAWADLTTSVQNVDIKVSLWYNQMIYRIGASGVVYGWMGMRLVTSAFSPYHRSMDTFDLFIILATLAYDLNQSPITLDDLRLSTLLEGDGVDHSAHLVGFMFGMAYAFILIYWIRFTLYGGLSWWRGGRNGRRLGTRWEDEQRIQQQREQRRQNSRLINQQRERARL